MLLKLKIVIALLKIEIAFWSQIWSTFTTTITFKKIIQLQLHLR